MAVKIGIPREIHPGEKRVAATPQSIIRLRKIGFDVAVETGAGEAINASVWWCEPADLFLPLRRRVLVFAKRRERDEASVRWT